MGHPLFARWSSVRTLIPIRLSLVVGAATRKNPSLLRAASIRLPLSRCSRRPFASACTQRRRR